MLSTSVGGWPVTVHPRPSDRPPPARILAAMQIPDQLRYTDQHEWVEDRGGSVVRLGITDYAQDALGDVVYAALPEVGRKVAAGESIAEVESTKSVAEVYAPLAGTVVAINEMLRDRPELINSDPYGGGWFAELELADMAELTALLDALTYRSLTET